MPVSAALLALLLSLPAPALAHGLFDTPLAERAPLLLTALFSGAAWALYALGARRVPARRHEALCFHGAMLLMVLAVFGPIDDWAQTST
ncbi:MAG: cytochrome c oxidase assembly protein, partial [Pseudomonas sp.]